MVVGYHRAQRRLMDFPAGDKAKIGQRPAQNACIQLAALQQANLLIDVIFHRLKADRRELASETSQRPDQQRLQHRRADIAEPQQAPAAGGDLFDGGAQVVDPLHRALRLLKQQLPFDRQADLTFVTLEQPDAPALLQRLNMLAQRGLRQADLRRRAGKMQGARQGNEGSQLRVFHDSPDNSYLLIKA